MSSRKLLVVDDEIITMEKLKEALQTKNGMSPGEGNLNSEFYECAGASFPEKLLFFLNNIYVMGEKSEEWKNSVIMYVCV
jgi:hypothetical protein